VEVEFGLYTFEMALKPTCYMESDFEQYDAVAANDDDYDDCENLYTIPG